MNNLDHMATAGAELTTWNSARIGLCGCSSCSIFRWTPRRRAVPTLNSANSFSKTASRRYNTASMPGCAPARKTCRFTQARGERVPDDGEVRLICITDKQFERQQIFWGKMRKQPQKAPKQLEFF